jgi:hypothetical protein
MQHEEEQQNSKRVRAVIETEILSRAPPMWSRRRSITFFGALMSQLANRPATPLAARTKPVNPRYANEDDEDTLLPRVHLYQGLPAEAKQYGKGFEPGDLINTMTGKKVESRKFIPLFGFNQWIVWKEPRGSGIEISTRNRADLSPEDLEWDRANNTPPRAQKYMQFVVLFEGEAMPLILPFTKTGMNAGRTLNSLEKLRINKGPGLYELSTKEKTNDKGSWLQPNVRPLGDPPPELANQAADLFGAMNPQAVTANMDGTVGEASGDEDDDLPI